MGYLLNEGEQYFFAKNTGKKPFKLDYDRSGTCGDEATLRRRRQLCIDAGLIRQATLGEVADELFTVEELKQKLKAAGQKVGGKKSELLDRLRSVDSSFDASLPVPEYWMLTHEGERIRSEIWQDVRAGEAVITMNVMALLTERRYDEAFRAYQEFVANDRTGMMCIDQASFHGFVGKMDALPGGEREQAIFSVMGGRPHYTRAAMSAQKSAYYQRDLLSYRQTPFTIGVEIHPSSGNDCSFACQYAGCYRLEDAPDFPFGPCGNDEDGLGCTCYWTSISDGKIVDEWKKPIRRHPDAGPLIERPPEPLTEDGIRRLAEVMNGMAGTSIQEEDIQNAIDNARNRGQLSNDNRSGRALVIDESVSKKHAAPGSFWAWLKSLVGL